MPNLVFFHKEPILTARIPFMHQKGIFFWMWLKINHKQQINVISEGSFPHLEKDLYFHNGICSNSFNSPPVFSQANVKWPLVMIRKLAGIEILYRNTW